MGTTGELKRAMRMRNHGGRVGGWEVELVWYRMWVFRCAMRLGLDE